MIEEIKTYGRVIQIRSRTLAVNAYIIIYDEYLVIVDSLLLPADSKELLKTALSYDKPLRYLINSHYHSDHCLGNRILKQADTIQINQQDYWDTIVRERAMLHPRKYKPIDETRLTKADITINKDYLELPDLMILLTPGHSPDGLCCYVPSQKALLAGDTIISNTTAKYNLPYFYWGSCAELILSLEKLACFEIEQIFSGHGNPVRSEKLYSDLKYLNNLRNRFNEYNLMGLSESEITRKLSLNTFLDNKIEVAVPSVHELNIQRLLIESRSES
ncbi:MAG: MBL fold metallo-hydrolase [Candidatus Cloacimonetes bacterium]|nr:MBL fold metallo-hydrolase [Candidatus Cloacimonadota bacterium]